VTVITGYSSGRPVGLACNSFVSVSLDPPLVSFCAARASDTWPELRAAGRFCVNFMAAHQEELTRVFARKQIDRFSDVSHHPRAGGPALDDAVAWLDCELRAEYVAGDHFLVLAEVVDHEASRGRAPLVFFCGRYGTVADAGKGSAVHEHNDPVESKG
jgi:3-hydroxy-9,10-secoandrosta-1,3,5(10)-triene-9,17-dione monooxygenase reductase component